MQPCWEGRSFGSSVNPRAQHLRSTLSSTTYVQLIYSTAVSNTLLRRSVAYSSSFLAFLMLRMP